MNGHVTRQTQQAKRDRLERLIGKIRTNRPWWASRPPWEVEAHLEARAKSQLRLFREGGAK